MLDAGFYVDQLARHRASPRWRQQYGLQWGDPETVPPLRRVRDRWVRPYVHGDQIAVEIGPGGGRWTRYLLGFERLFVVEYSVELLAELARTVRADNLVPVMGSGADFPGVPPVDFAFSFDVFVHLAVDAIGAYLANLRSILRPKGNAVIHYADQTKVMARETPSFADNDPATMRALVMAAGFEVVEEDTTSLWHSSLIRFTPRR